MDKRDPHALGKESYTHMPVERRHAHTPKLAFLVAEKAKAKNYHNMISSMYPSTTPEEADVLVVLGGDGFMLHCIQTWNYLNKPFYGINLGSTGRLLNAIPVTSLIQQIAVAKPLTINFLRLDVLKQDKERMTYFAVNEIFLFRQGCRAAKLQVSIDGVMRLKEFMGDGLLVSTSVGSLAYNFSVGGPILPFQAPLLSMMPISPYAPRNWRGALISQEAIISIRALGGEKRGVSAVADNQEVFDAEWVTISKTSEKKAILLFEKENTWNQSVLRAQFE